MLFPPPSVAGSWQHLLARASEAEGAGHDEAALKLCLEACKLAVGDAVAFEACNAFTEATADRHVARTEAADAARLRGNAAFSENDIPTALSAYTEALAHTPNNAMVLTNRAACLLRQDDAEAALADCTKALRIEPTRIKAAYRGGQALLALQRPLGAKAMLDAALLQCTSKAERAGLHELLTKVTATLATGDAQATALAEAGGSWGPASSETGAPIDVSSAEAMGDEDSRAVATGGRDEGGKAARGVRGAVRAAAAVAADHALASGLAHALLTDAHADEFRAKGYTMLQLDSVLGGSAHAATPGSAASKTADSGVAVRPADLLATFGPGALGLGLADYDGRVVISSVDAGMAAEAQGVAVGLAVLEVNGESVSGRDKKAVVGLIKGAARPLRLKLSLAPWAAEAGEPARDAGQAAAAAGRGGAAIAAGGPSHEAGSSAREQLAELVRQARALHEAGYCTGGQQNETGWRDDTACWLTAAAASTAFPALSGAVALLACIAHELNERCGIRDSGMHAQRGRLLRVPEAAMFAAYAGDGARYKPHRDNGLVDPCSAAEDESALLNDRAVTIIIYLNEPDGWEAATGGQLRIHPESAQADDEALFATGWDGGHSGGGGAGAFADVMPTAGHVAVFRSELLHEVLPTADGRLRLALSMWCVR